jgi:hypothetical protein
MYIGADGGFTQINNSLIVKSSTTLEGDVTLSGGLNSGEFQVTRGSFGTDADAHIQGDIDNANIDLFTKQDLDRAIATDGNQPWGDTGYKVGTPVDEYYLTFDLPSTTINFEVGAYVLIDRSRLAIEDPTRFSATGASGGNQLVNCNDVTWVNELTGDITDNYVEIQTDGATFDDGTRVAQISSITGTTITLNKTFSTLASTSLSLIGGESTQGQAPIGQEYSELVQILELTNLNAIGTDAPLQIKVKRAMNQRNDDGTLITGTPPNQPSGTPDSGYKFIRADHPANAPLVRYNLAENVSYIDQVGGLTSTTSGTSEDVETGDFSGSVGVGDILRFTDSELALITAINTTSPQKLVVTDGNDSNPVIQFEVDSTNGDTIIAGNLEVNKSITLEGSTADNSQKLIITNGSGTTTFQVDSADGDICSQGDLWVGGSECDRLRVTADTGDTTLRGGNFVITGDNTSNQKMIVNNNSGNLTLAGVLDIEGSAANNFDGQIIVNGGQLQVNTIDDSPLWQAETSYAAGDTVYNSTNIYTVGTDGTSGNTAPTHSTGSQTIDGIVYTFLKLRQPEELFEIEGDGSMNFAGQEGFFTPRGARKWEFVGAGESVKAIESNVNYFIAPASDLTMTLPSDASVGDMIRIVDVGGNLTYNISLRMRAPNGINVQGDNTNGNSPDLSSTNYDGGELVVQTPHAAFGLIYLGSTNFDGTSTGAPSSTLGWWLMEI